MATTSTKKPLLEVRDLKQHFPITTGNILNRQLSY